MDDTRWDVHERAFCHYLINPIQHDHTAALQNVVQLGGALVIMKLGSVNIHGVSPGCRCKGGIFMADQTVTPAAGTAFARGVAFVTDEQGSGRVHP